MERAIASAPETLPYGPEALEVLRTVNQFVSSMAITYHSNNINISDVVICEENIKRVKATLPECGATEAETAALRMIRDELGFANEHLGDLRSFLAQQVDGAGRALLSYGSSKKHLGRAVTVLALILEKQAEKATGVTVASELDADLAATGDQAKEAAAPGAS
ncbi:MAG: hypothetical protein UT33_C0015G0025 [Candidatus Peregrinibacteria bacterium GW2011_GWC2_39_14]|nr:MAG: hypothetical protein US92_C0007G0025 [Candidatus Peregrinibacteria bacterium GW2011_GWA2_38_36]KKR04968.1 MAG: hypothetical protein UT33_C0015G0025 [Candidatus Peregrinibacteria bacterium GW2011_GWC2_39_14]